MIKTVKKMGDPGLLQLSLPVLSHEFDSIELHQLIEDLCDTREHLGGVGIAAPQIGVNRRVVVIEYYEKNMTRYKNTGDCPRKVIINPEITLLDGPTATFFEGCLSVPGIRGAVTRPVAIKYKYYDQSGRLYSGEDHSFFARAMQHECDHLDGILFPMRMQDMSTLTFTDVLPPSDVK